MEYRSKQISEMKRSASENFGRTEDFIRQGAKNMESKPKKVSSLTLLMAEDSFHKQAEKQEEHSKGPQDIPPLNRIIERKDSNTLPDPEHLSLIEFQNNIKNSIDKLSKQKNDQLQEITEMLYQKTNNILKSLKLEDIMDRSIMAFELSIKVFSMYEIVNKNSVSKEKIDEFKENSLFLYNRAKDFDDEIMKKYKLGEVEREDYLKAKKVMWKAFRVWLKINHD